jgi:hypothetical protein
MGSSRVDAYSVDGRLERMPSVSSAQPAAEWGTRCDVRIPTAAFFQLLQGKFGAICTPRPNGDICDSGRPAAVGTARSRAKPVRKMPSGALAILNFM